MSTGERLNCRAPCDHPKRGIRRLPGRLDLNEPGSLELEDVVPPRHLVDRQRSEQDERPGETEKPVAPPPGRDQEKRPDRRQRPGSQPVSLIADRADLFIMSSEANRAFRPGQSNDGK